MGLNIEQAASRKLNNLVATRNRVFNKLPFAYKKDLLPGTVSTVGKSVDVGKITARIVVAGATAVAIDQVSNILISPDLASAQGPKLNCADLKSNPVLNAVTYDNGVRKVGAGTPVPTPRSREEAFDVVDRHTGKNLKTVIEGDKISIVWKVTTDPVGKPARVIPVEAVTGGQLIPRDGFTTDIHLKPVIAIEADIEKKKLDDAIVLCATDSLDQSLAKQTKNGDRIDEFTDWVKDRLAEFIPKVETDSNGLITVRKDSDSRTAELIYRLGMLAKWTLVPGMTVLSMVKRGVMSRLRSGGLGSAIAGQELVAMGPARETENGMLQLVTQRNPRADLFKSLFDGGKTFGAVQLAEWGLKAFFKL